MEITELRKAADKERWMQSYNRLKNYIEEHRKLPTRKDNATLYSWMTAQRKTARIIHLDLHQKELLQRIGVPLRQKRLSFLGCVERYKKDPNHDYCKKWKWRMIQRYRKGTLNDFQIAQLKKLFDLNTKYVDDRSGNMRRSNERKHEEAFVRNVEFFKRYMDEWQRPYMTYRERKKANNWRTRMRQLYNEGKLTDDKIKILQELFNLNPNKNRNDHND